MNDLVILENVNAVEVFCGKGLDDLLGKITEEAKSVLPDVTTEKGRKAIISTAAKVAKSKTYLDGLRKGLVEEWTAKTKAVNSEGKKMRDTLDALRDEIRNPVTEYETAQKERTEKLEAGIREITEAAEHTANNWMELPLEAMVDRLAEIEKEPVESYEEFAPVAAGAKDRTIISMKESIAKREAYDKEQEELEKLRAESAERERKDQEEKLRLEGEERAKLEAESKAREELERVEFEKKEADRIVNELAATLEREKQDAINAQNEAEKRALEAKENAKIEVEKAAQAERDRIESERLAEEIAAKKREANKAHKSKINNAILEAFVVTGMNKTQAKKAVTAIAKGQIPYTAISY